MTETGLFCRPPWTAAQSNSPVAEQLDRHGCRILRARGWRLYTEGGRRLIDLRQYGGRAILGHNPPGLLRTIKNCGERSLFVPFPHPAEARLLKALAALFPRRTFRLYPDEGSRRSALAAAVTVGAIPLWRPWLEEAAGNNTGCSAAGYAGAAAGSPVFIPVLPFPFPGAPAVLVLDETLEHSFPPSPLLSPLALTAAARCVWDLIAVYDRRKRYFPKLEKALNQNRCWKRQGIYLACAAGEIAYTEIFRHFLENGFLLPASPEENAILPGELSPGEEAALAKLLLFTGPEKSK